MAPSSQQIMGGHVNRFQIPGAGHIMVLVSTQPIPRLTVEEYLVIERAAETRSEYIGGQMYAMAGASLNHSLLIGATFAALYSQLRDGKCSPVSTDLRLFVPKHDVITYPDILVACRPFQFHDNRRDTLSDTSVIVEVLSPSTANYDLGEKFRYYRALPSFTDYLLVAQDAVRVLHHTRQPDGSWLMREFLSPDDEVVLPSIGGRLRLKDIYEQIDFNQESPT